MSALPKRKNMPQASTLSLRSETFSGSSQPAVSDQIDRR
jgi:hypothetical protein